MNKRISCFFVLLLFLCGFFENAHSLTNKVRPSYYKDFILDGDDFVPIPWGKELPILMQTLPGTWLLKIGRQTSASYFTFQVVNTLAPNKMLYIKQVDAATCRVLGSGVANQFDSKIIYATLRSNVNRQVYRINFRNYDVNSFVKNTLPTQDGHVMLMSIAPINSTEFQHYPLARVEINPQGKLNCRENLIK